MKGKQKHKQDLCFNFELGENMHVFINKNLYNPTFIISSEPNSPVSPVSPASPDSKFIISSELNSPVNSTQNLSKILDNSDLLK